MFLATRQQQSKVCEAACKPCRASHRLQTRPMLVCRRKRAGPGDHTIIHFGRCWPRTTRQMSLWQRWLSSVADLGSLGESAASNALASSARHTAASATAPKQSLIICIVEPVTTRTMAITMGPLLVGPLTFRTQCHTLLRRRPRLFHSWCRYSARTARQQCAATPPHNALGIASIIARATEFRLRLPHLPHQRPCGQVWLAVLRPSRAPMEGL